MNGGGVGAPACCLGMATSWKWLLLGDGYFLDMATLRVQKYPNMRMYAFSIRDRDFGLGHNASYVGTWTLRARVSKKPAFWALPTDLGHCFSILQATWRPRVCKLIAFWALPAGLAHYFGILLKCRYNHVRVVFKGPLGSPTATTTPAPTSPWIRARSQRAQYDFFKGCTLNDMAIPNVF